MVLESAKLEFRVKLPLRWEEVKKFSNIGISILISHGKGRRKLLNPVTVRIERGFTKADISLFNYIAMALLSSSNYIPAVWESRSLRELAAYLRRNKTQSKSTLYRYVYEVFRFCNFLHVEPDDLILSLLGSDGNPIPKQVKWIRKQIEAWMDELIAEDYAPKSIKLAIDAIKTWLWVNEIDVGKIALPVAYTRYPTRAPTPEELQRLIEVADLREKAMVSILALSGLRIGTLISLKYKHVKPDLEAGRIPVCIYIKAEETKGKFCDYFTFIGKEAVDYLKLYLEERKKGSAKIPPEEITDESPLFRTKEDVEVRPLTYSGAYNALHNLMIKAGLITKDGRRRYELNIHSFRKYFKTQLTAKGVPADYIEFMMGHKISTYNDVKSLGIEKLREIYARSGISIKPQTRPSKLEMLKEIVRSLGLDPEKVLVKDAILEPKRTAIDESSQIEVLQEAVKDWIKRIVKEVGV